MNADERKSGTRKECFDRTSPRHGGKAAQGMSKTHRVALVTWAGGEYGRQIRRGFRRFFRAQEGWVDRTLPDKLSGHRVDVSTWRPEGIVVLPRSRKMLRGMTTLGIPMVSCGHRQVDGVLRLDFDDVAVGRCVAEYFLEKNFQHFAFFGTREGFSLSREAGVGRRWGLNAKPSCGSMRALSCAGRLRQRKVRG